jgi:hypothetical protein
MLKAWHNQKKIHVQNIQILNAQSFFISTKCASFLLKIGKDFNIDD